MKPLPPAPGWPGACRRQRVVGPQERVDEDQLAGRPGHVDAPPQREGAEDRQSARRELSHEGTGEVPPWQRKVISESAKRDRISSAAACAARIDENSPASGPRRPG